MAEQAINLNHTTGTITSSDDTIVNVSKTLMIGNGETFKNTPSDKLEEGMLKVVQDKDGVPQLYGTNQRGQWVHLGEPYDETQDMIWAIIMSD